MARLAELVDAGDLDSPGSSSRKAVQVRILCRAHEEVKS